MNDYIYSAESDRFPFLRVPKILLQNEVYSRLSAEAKLLYSLLFDRTELSNKNGWVDGHDRVYIVFTISEIMENLNCGNKKAIQLLDELENKAGLIERKRQGQGKPNLIYVKSFYRTVDNSGERHFLKCENDTSKSVKTTSLEVSETHSNKTNIMKTDMSDTDPSFLPGSEAKGNDEYQRYEEYFRRKLEIAVLIHDSPADTDTLMGILDLLAETCSSKRKSIRIAGDDKPIDVVKSRLMKLSFLHIKFVLNCLRENTTNVRDMKQYLLTTLFNAPVTMDPYYQARVNHDFYGKYN